jgi:hypothetical protein
MEKAICIRVEADARQIMNCREVVQELDTSFEDLSTILSLTGNAVRLKILYLLHQEGHLCVCDLSNECFSNFTTFKKTKRQKTYLRS